MIDLPRVHAPGTEGLRESARPRHRSTSSGADDDRIDAAEPGRFVKVFNQDVCNLLRIQGG
jgi:hypothetical protein